MLVRQTITGVLVCVVLLGTTPVDANPAEDTTSANTTEAARTLAYSGIDAYEAGNFVEAERQLSEAYAMLKAPSLGLWSARAMAKLGALIEADARLRELAAQDAGDGDPVVQREALREAALEIEQLRERIPTLTIRITGAIGTPQVSVDAKPLTTAQWSIPYPMNPGEHRIEAVVAGQLVTREITLREYDRQVIELSFAEPEPNPTPTGSTSNTTPSSTTVEPSSFDLKTAGWVTLAGGGVLLAAGTTFALIASSRLEDIRNNPNCERDACDFSEKGLVDSYDDAKTFSTIGHVSGGIVAAVGIGLIVFSSSHDSNSPELAVSIAPNHVRVAGRF